MNILLTSVGRRGYIVDYFKAALNGEGEVHAANSILTLAMKAADKHVLTPLIYGNDYIEFLINYCRKNNIVALLSLFDIDLLVLAKNEAKFRAIGVRLILAPEESVEICNDKWRTFQFLKEYGIRTPKTYVRLEDTMDAIASGEISYPLVIKPRWGMGSMAIYFAENEIELKVLYEKSRREVFASYLKYESGMTPDHAVIIQEKLIGQEHGVDVLNDLAGSYVDTFPKTKAVMRAGETDVGVTVDKTPFEGIAIKLSQKLAHAAILSVDCFVCSDGVYVVEMNCRISGHYPLSHLAGVNVPRQLILWLKGGETDHSLMHFKTGLTIVKDLVPRIL